MHIESTPTSPDGNKTLKKQPERTNIPTTEKIASLNLKRQNVITFSSSNRVLKTQWAESVEIRIIISSSFALTTAKEIEALVEARVNSEARTELEIRLREVEEREAMQVQAL